MLKQKSLLEMQNGRTLVRPFAIVLRSFAARRITSSSLPFSFSSWPWFPPALRLDERRAFLGFRPAVRSVSHEAAAGGVKTP
jgi:hypothetical protein